MKDGRVYVIATILLMKRKHLHVGDMYPRRGRGGKKHSSGSSESQIFEHVALK